MRNIFFLCLFFLTLSGCSKSYEPDSKDIKIASVELPPKDEVVYNEDAAQSAPSAPKDKQEIEQKIIKQAHLRFETDNLENTFNQIKKAIITHNGNVLNDTEGKNYDNVSRVLVIKVPSQNFDRFIDAVSKGVSYFDEKQISAEDVTEQYIDLTSRLKTKKKLEERYLEILKKANKVSEILEIEKQISAIREEIEAKEGQLKYLESRVSESTVTIEFYKTIAEKEGVKISYGSKIWTAIKSGFFSLSDFLISLISVWPFVILFVVFAYFIRKRLKRRKKE
ncbi:DUF4349 domain-containing protein [Flavobacterium sp. HBTb2-11-1]|uniref:DUF4349 domain-containing protein n=1 Tax=Flavobacterium sp. HBTb2-11-1 TaxID=2692212 RepID=UPI0013690199|nr:DUF4349 domain-containing protein [Flavobacterium sp. HBTb2-11-1]MXO07300.1 DUF4349 domain-containing protein [Flavobacterium sp. HBTb2-11-1]